MIQFYRDEQATVKAGDPIESHDPKEGFMIIQDLGFVKAFKVNWKGAEVKEKIKRDNPDGLMLFCGDLFLLDTKTVNLLL